VIHAVWLAAVQAQPGIAASVTVADPPSLGTCTVKGSTENRHGAPSWTIPT
jgi:hypothetical protein